MRIEQELTRSHPKEATVWRSMRRRCTHKGDDSGAYYYKGITVCKEWRRSFAKFLLDVGERPSKDHQLHRIDNNKGYEPGNVRWVDSAEHSRIHNANRTIRKFAVDHIGVAFNTKTQLWDVRDVINGRALLSGVSHHVATKWLKERTA